MASYQATNVGDEPSSSAEPAESPITFAQLKKLNIIAAALHFLQFILMLGATFGVENFRNFQLPFEQRVLVPVPFVIPGDNTTSFLLELQTKEIGTIAIAPLVAVFSLLSALFQGATALSCFNERYNKQIAAGINYFRWYEYAISSSLMIFIIAMFTGVYDWSTLFCIVILNATMNLLGLVMEKVNQNKEPESFDWLPFNLGCLCGFAPWIVVFAALIGAEDVPSFVYGIFVAYFIMFNTFPINMVLQYKKIGKWADYRYGERVYIILSFVAKSLLAWLVFGGLNQPNNFTD
jgi:hypothetical protein